MSFSFEHDMQGWTAGGADLDNLPAHWSVERSRDIASDGRTSVRLYLNDINDEGKVWIERLFDVEPGRTYQVQVEYDFASADWGYMNLWTIITGVVPKAPGQPGGLVYQGDTKNNARPEDGFAWRHKRYHFSVQPGPEGKLYVVIGICGTRQTARTYYLDNITLTGTVSAEAPVPSTPTVLQVTTEADY
jgi:hypothetical protein